MSSVTKRDESGIASMLVTLIMMVVISLIVIGFAQVARRNQRESIDHQLSTQAYYAAETGINDASKLIAQQLTSGAVESKTNCVGGSTPSSIYSTSLNTTVDATANTSYTCLLINPFPDTLLYALVSQANSTVVPINTSKALGHITFGWSMDTSGNPDPASCNDTGNNLPTAANWACGYALVRLDLTKDTGSYDETTLANNTASFYLKPNASGSSITVNNFGAGSQKAYINAVSCSTATKKCSATIDLNGAAQGNKYYLRMSTYYRDAPNMEISAIANDGTSVVFSGAQAVIDSTGKAQDQLRRISVRLKLTNTPNGSAAALRTTDDICKQFTIGGALLAPDPPALCP